MTTLTDGRADGRSLRATAQRESRRAEILSAALRLFAKNGYHQTRVSDIIEAAGIARGTFYIYFESKNAIFLELLSELLAQLNDAIVGVDTSPGAPPVEEQLKSTTQRLLDTVSSNRLLTTIIVREAVGLDAECDQRLAEFYGGLLRYIRAALEEGKRMGLVRDVDNEIASMCILGTIKQLMEQIVTAEGTAQVDVGRMAFAVLDFNLRGVLAV
jgi:AcrR family transcriptional regulator